MSIIVIPMVDIELLAGESESEVDGVRATVRCTIKLYTFPGIGGEA